jgi:hypothetical protein
MISRVVGGFGALVLAAVSLQAIGRQLTRTAWIPGLPDTTLGLVALALIAGLAATVALPSRRRLSVFATALACGLTIQLHVGARVQSDAFYYYAYLRSLVFDGDVSLANDYRMIGLGDKPHLFEPTPTGYAHSAWTVGPAIVWSPFFAAGHVAATQLAARGRDVAVDGTSYPYRQSIVIAGLVYGLLGFWLTLRLCDVWFRSRVSDTAVALIAGGSFMLWYTLIEPTMTHAPSMAAVAGFLLYWSRTRDTRSIGGWLALGVLAGVMTLIRWQNLLFALVPACDAIGALVAAWRRGDRAALRHVLTGGVVFTITAAVTFLPQMIAWKAIYGSWLAVSPVGPKIRLLDPQLVLTVFSSRNGLVAMSPILYVALAGLGLFAWRHRRAGGPLVLAVLIMIWFNASVQDWWGSDGFGGRRFDGIIPIAALGLATALEGLTELARTRPQWVVAGAAGLLVAWNATLMTAAQRGIVRLGEAVDYGRVGAAQAQIWHEWIGHPFSYPANLWFALRNAVSPAAYDRLGPALFLGDPLQPTGRIDVGGDDALLIGAGWFGPEQDGATTYRWSDAGSELLVPLAHQTALTIQIRLRAFTYVGAPPQLLTIETGRQTFGPFPVAADWDVINIETPADAWRTGLNRVRLRFDYATRPLDVGPGQDGRALAAAVDVFRVTAR